jgi:hypothetical protein
VPARSSDRFWIDEPDFYSCVAFIVTLSKYLERMVKCLSQRLQWAFFGIILVGAFDGLLVK